jgi:DNA-binding NtrC family response regulator
MSDKRVILLVDDEATTLGEVRTRLEMNFDLLLASDGVVAAYLFERSSYQIGAIVTNFFIPRLDGQALAEWVHHIRPRLPVVIIENGEVGELACDAAVRILSNPFEISQLEYELNDAFAEAQMDFQ